MTQLANKQEAKALALAGLFQAATQVQAIARSGSAETAQLPPLLNSIFVLDAESVEEVYGGVAGVSAGIDALIGVLSRGQTGRHSDAIRYVIGMVQIEKLLRRHDDINEILRTRLEQLTHQMQHFDGVTDPNLISRLNDIYLDSLAKLQFRIHVNGLPEHLQQTSNAEKIRAILLAGVRSAMLWRQLGGSRFEFVFAKRKLLRSLAALQVLAAERPETPDSPDSPDSSDSQ